MAAMAAGSESPDLPAPLTDWFVARGWVPPTVEELQQRMLELRRATSDPDLKLPAPAMSEGP